MRTKTPESVLTNVVAACVIRVGTVADASLPADGTAPPFTSPRAFDSGRAMKHMSALLRRGRAQCLPQGLRRTAENLVQLGRLCLKRWKNCCVASDSGGVSLGQ